MFGLEILMLVSALVAGFFILGLFFAMIAHPPKPGD